MPFGKILRIDPNGTNSGNGQYGIPATNPFATDTTGKLKEIYAYGFRNPYRFSFDSATGQLWVGDVGQSNREEVDTVTNGSNYGWPFREGTRDNSADAGRTTPAGFTSISPIGEYTHGDGIATIGGFIYHGSDIPALDGKYVFGDLGGPSAHRPYVLHGYHHGRDQRIQLLRRHGADIEFVWLRAGHQRRAVRAFFQRQHFGHCS